MPKCQLKYVLSSPSCFQLVFYHSDRNGTVISSVSGTLRTSSFPKALPLNTVKLDTRIEQRNYRGGDIRLHSSSGFRVFERTWFMWLKLRHNNHASLGLHPLRISCPGHTHPISWFLFFSFQCHLNTSTVEPSLITLCRQPPPHGWLVLMTYNTWWKPEWRQTPTL